MSDRKPITGELVRVKGRRSLRFAVVVATGASYVTACLRMDNSGRWAQPRAFDLGDVEVIGASDNRAVKRARAELLEGLGVVEYKGGHVTVPTYKEG